jgi:hypothetical protein
VRKHLRRLVAPDRAGHLDADAAIALLERDSEEVRPLLLHGIGIEAERLGVLGDVTQGRDDASVAGNGLQRGHELVVDERVGREALAKIGGLDRLRVLDVRRLLRVVGLLDRLRRLRHEEVDVVRVDSRRGLVRARDAERVRSRLVVRRRDEDAVERVSVGEHLGADALLVDVEHAFLVEHFDGDRLLVVGDDEGARGDGVGDGGGEPRCVRAAAQENPVPPPVVVAVHEGITELIRTDGRLVGIRLLEREPPRPRCCRAVGRVVGHGAVGRRCDALDGRTRLERGRRVGRTRCRRGRPGGRLQQPEQEHSGNTRDGDSSVNHHSTPRCVPATLPKTAEKLRCGARLTRICPSVTPRRARRLSTRTSRHRRARRPRPRVRSFPSGARAGAATRQKNRPEIVGLATRPIATRRRRNAGSVPRRLVARPDRPTRSS